MVLAQLFLAAEMRLRFFKDIKPGVSYATARIQTQASLHRPWLSLRRRRMPRCGACGDAPVLRSPGDRREQHAQDAPGCSLGGVHVGQPAPKTPSKASHEARGRPEECLRVDERSTSRSPKSDGFVTNRHGLKAFVLISYFFLKGRQDSFLQEAHGR